jgi:adenine phosphoribosyltransferase
MMAEEEVYTIELGGVSRHLPLVRVAPGIRVALLNIMCDPEIVNAVVPLIARLLPDDTEVLLHPEGKAIPLVYQLSGYTGLPYVVPRKERKQWMLAPISSDVQSITTGRPQTYWLDQRDVPRLAGKRIAIVDDVISTGSTLQAMESLAGKVGGTVVARLAIFTEGEERADVQALGHLPLFPEAE